MAPGAHNGEILPIGFPLYSLITEAVVHCFKHTHICQSTSRTSSTHCVVCKIQCIETGITSK